MREKICSGLCKLAVSLGVPLILALMSDYLWIDGEIPFGVMSIIFFMVFGVGGFAVWYNGNEIYCRLFEKEVKWKVWLFYGGYFLMWSGVMVSLLLMML